MSRWRTSISFEVGCYALYARLAAAARARLQKPLLKEALMKFEELGLAEPLLRALAQGYPTTTKIQAAAIPPIIEGRDVLGCADGHRQDRRFRLAHLAAAAAKECRVNGRGRKIRTLVLAPTRELALQICREFPGLRPLYRPCGKPRSTAASASRRKCEP